MNKVAFISAQPFLTLSLRGELPEAIQFIQHRYHTDNPQEIAALMKYADEHETIIAVEAQGVELSELIRLHKAQEQRIILEAEAREKEREEQKKQKKEEHDFYSILRGADHAFR